MFLYIKELLTKAESQRLLQFSSELNFVDGRVSNPANVTKQNQQVDHSDPQYEESTQIVHAALTRNQQFMDFSLPKKIAPPLLCRYEPGMKYGGHADSAIIALPNGVQLRSDLSCTVFVTDARSYEGGELSILLGNRAFPVKGAPGDAIVYPSTTLHEVMPVRQGKRAVSITFIESFICDHHKREQVYELNEIAALEGNAMTWENRIRLDVVRQNLMRMWAQT